MKTKFLLFAGLLCLVGCSMFSSPTAAVKKLIASAEKGDVDTMNSLFSESSIQRSGIEKIRSSNQNFSQMVRGVIAGGVKLEMNQINEVVTGDRAHVTFLFQDTKKINSMRMVYDLVKEGGAWKIDTTGSELSVTGGGSPAPDDVSIRDTPLPDVVEPPLPPASESAAASPSPSKPGVISGGVLNGKAISLPKPPYPPAARAAKASGTVTVQVLIDEEGNVVSANATSGHPLLRAAAVSAARAAKFAPTQLGQQPVKVSGVVTYNFVAE